MKNLNPGFLLSFFFCLFAFVWIGCAPSPIELVSAPQDAAHVNHGRELARGLAACGFCHGPKASPDDLLSGGQTIYDTYGEVVAPNITPSRAGIGAWTTVELMRALRSSYGRDSKELSTDAHAGFEWMSDRDALSLVAYLRSLPASPNKVKRRGIGFIDRNTTGFFESHKEVRGFVPEISARFPVEYGQYLLEHVARCQSCHNSPGGLVNISDYLDGGTVVKRAAGEKVAPGISNSTQDGIGTWTEGQIVTYLQTGVTPEEYEVDRDFCPIDFYKNAPVEDLQAIAKYIKALEE